MLRPVRVSSSATPSGIRWPSIMPLPPGEQAPLHLGQPERGVGRGHDHVAAEQQLEPAGHGGGVGGADERDRELSPLTSR